MQLIYNSSMPRSGSEADGTLGRGMVAMQKNGTAVTLYFNNGGTIQSLSLGTLA